LNTTGDAENLADVNVGAVFINLRVVMVKECRVDSGRVLDTFAIVTKRDDVDVVAVFAGVPETEGLSGYEVCATSVDDPLVEDGELVCRNLVGS